MPALEGDAMPTLKQMRGRQTGHTGDDDRDAQISIFHCPAPLDTNAYKD
jgi:hypothetical protein